jgi:hypothetical protein
VRIRRRTILAGPIHQYERAALSPPADPENYSSEGVDPVLASYTVHVALAPSGGEPQQRSFKILLVSRQRRRRGGAVTYTACTNCVQAICKTVYWSEASTPSISSRQPVYGTA